MEKEDASYPAAVTLPERSKCSNLNCLVCDGGGWLGVRKGRPGSGGFQTKIRQDVVGLLVGRVMLPEHGVFGRVFSSNCRSIKECWKIRKYVAVIPESLPISLYFPKLDLILSPVLEPLEITISISSNNIRIDNIRIVNKDTIVSDPIKITMASDQEHDDIKQKT
ncbi:hypothetical protein CEXT_195091 [Caerostris extrusa]|uniref:Uncharacterized protein n=1 Tax=Caerostris extrusa TaxID=172846 RepID=A0AAV4M849_CAEEX|nr:hypothetical protein CEXT_195091 [Caerostris extrusa]